MSKYIEITNQNGVILNTNGKICENDIYVIPMLQNKEVTVTESAEITPDEGYTGLSKVTITADHSSAYTAYDNTTSVPYRVTITADGGWPVAIWDSNSNYSSTTNTDAINNYITSITNNTTTVSCHSGYIRVYVNWTGRAFSNNYTYSSGITKESSTFANSTSTFKSIVFKVTRDGTITLHTLIG